MIRWLTKKKLFAFHGWLGITFGLPLFIICFSGAMAVMSPEIDRMIHPEMRIATPADPSAEPLSWGTLLAKIEQACPGGEVAFIDGVPERNSAWQASVSFSPKDQRLVFIDPFTGEILGQRTTFNVRSFFRIFHKQFYIVGGDFWPHGRVIVCSFSIVLFFAAVTGLMFYKGWWKHLFRLRVGRGPRIFWSDLHRFAGVWSFLLAIMFAITGFWYLLVRLMEDFDLAEHDPIPEIPAEVSAMRPAVLPRLDMDQLVAKAHELYPDLQIRVVGPGARQGSCVSFYGEGPLSLSSEMTNQVHLDPYTGEPLLVAKAHELPIGARLASMTDPVHFGRFGGYATKFIWAAAGLALGTGILAGAILWWMRVRRDPEHGHGKLRRWAIVSLVLNTVVFALAAVSTYGFIRAQVIGPQGSKPGLALGEMEIGPWKVAAFQHGEITASGGTFSFLFTGEGDPNYKVVYSWSGTDRDPHGLKELGGSRRRLFSVQAIQDGRLNLEIEGHDGTKHPGRFMTKDSATAAALPVPPAPEVPAGVWWISGTFLALILVPSCFWFAKVR